MDRLLIEETARFVREMDTLANVRPVTRYDAKQDAEDFGTPTVYDNYNYVSSVKNLSTALTVYLGSEQVQKGVYTQKKREIRRSAPHTIRALLDYLKRVTIVKLECGIGRNSEFSPNCALYLSTYRKESIRMAWMVAGTLFDKTSPGGPQLTVVCVPEWQEKDRQVLVIPEIGVTFVLGTDYFGELKNAFLRMAMWQAKRHGMLGLHAGTQILKARGPDGSIRRVGVIMFGIAATGKTTHSCHKHGLDLPGEGIQVAQDDVVFWRPDGSALGSERGLYIKTEQLNPIEQPILYGAALCPDAILENVLVNHMGEVYFEDRTLTANGRGIVQREDMGEYAAPGVDLPPVDDLDALLIFFMTRSYSVIPVAGKLTPEQAAVAFMLNESIDAAGSDQPTPPGITFNPFLIGEAADEVNRFYEMLTAHGNKVECYMLNTGGVGEIVEHELDGTRKTVQKVLRIQIPEMAAIIRGIARGTVEWREDPNWMVQTPLRVEGLDIERFNLDRHYDQVRIDHLIAETRVERSHYAEQLKKLDPAIRAAAEW